MERLNPSLVKPLYEISSGSMGLTIAALVTTFVVIVIGMLLTTWLS